MIKATILAAAALAVSSASAASGFSNVTHLKNAVIAFGSSTSADGLDAFFPASDGSTVGVYESFDNGNTLQYDKGVGETAQAAILMATGLRDVSGQDMSVLVGGLFGTAISFDVGSTWQHVDPNPASNLSTIVTQDIKYESASDLYAMTGTILGQAAVSLSSDGGNTFEMVPITADFYEPYVRYGSYPSASTFYVTAGIWGDDSADKSSIKHRFTGRLSVDSEGKLVHHDIKDTNSTGYWAQVAKTTDGGATWSIVFEDFQNNLYPNDIHCYDENTCTFVMEGLSEPQILTTQDGGETWTTFNDNSGGVSLMAVRMMGPTEAWVAGGGDVGRMWHTTDLVNWSAYTTDLNDAAEIFSFAFTSDQSTAFATGVLRSQLCSILKLEV